MKQEIIRKLIHLSSLIYPLAYIFLLSKPTMIKITLYLLCLLIVVDFLRIKYTKFQSLCNKLFGLFSRKEEREGKIYGSTYFMCGIFLTILFFPKYTAITSMFVLIISDTAASIFGKMIKSKKIIKEKTIFGFLSFVCTATIIIFCFGQSFNFNTFLIALLIAFITGAVELFAKVICIDDNLLIPTICSFLITFTNYATISQII